MGDYKYIRVKGVGERLYDLGENLEEARDLCDSLPAIRRRMSDSLDRWQSELVNPVLWDEGEWEEVNIDIHRNLMNNRPVDCFTPGEFRTKYGKHRK